MPLPRALTVLALSVVLAACAGTGNIAPRAHLADPDALDAGSAIAAARGPGSWPSAQWWQALHDDQLDTLVARALAGNPGLHATAARVRQAAALAGISAQNTEPRAQLDITADRELYSEHGFAPPALAGHYAWRNQATLSGSYDLDLWGRQRQSLAAALAETDVAGAEMQMARLALETALVRTYIEFALQNELADILDASLAQRQRMVDIARQRQRAGLAAEIDLSLLEASLPAGERELTQARQAIVVLRNELAALCGQGPGAGEAIVRPTLAPAQTPGLPSVLPAELVGRRPDIAAQRWRVEAAARRIDVAEAEFYPNINLTAFAGLQSLGFGHVLDTGSAIRGVAPALSLPVFAGPRLRAQLEERTAAYDGAVEQYNASVVHALADVANAITQLQSLQQQQHQGERALATAGRAHALAERAFSAGLGDALTVLSARLAQLSEQQQLAHIRARQRDSFAALMAALGGGVEAGAP